MGTLSSRRTLLAGTVIGAAGAAAAFGSIGATPAQAATTATPDWINVTDPLYGADNSGTTDASSAINAAITAAPEGGVVYLPTGKYLIAGPIVVQKSVTLLGDHGATASGDDASKDYGTVILVASGFANPTYSGFANAAILCLDQSPGTSGSASTTGIRLRDLWIDGSDGPAGVDGITTYGPVTAWQAERVGVYKATGNGFSFQPADGGNADGQHLYSCLAQACGLAGFTGQMVDATLVDCHAQNCGTNGIYLTGGNTRFIGCRSDLNGQNGWYLDHSGAGDGYSDGIILDGCGTQRNDNNGVCITNSSSSSTQSSATWHDPVLITGCSFGEDGRTGTFAGILIEGENVVHISNTLVAVGTVDVKPNGCPAYGIQTGTAGGGTPLSITVTGGRVEAVTGLIDDAAEVQGDFKISPDTEGAIGYQSTAVISRQGSVTLSGGTATVTNDWASTSSRVFLSTLKTSSPGFLSVTRSEGSFVISSTSSSDASDVAWMLTTA